MKGLSKDNSGCKVTKADAWLKEAEARERFYEGLKLHIEDLPYFIRRLIREKVVDAEDVKIIIELENKEEKKMNWREINEKYMQLQAEGKSAGEAAEMLRDEIGEIAKECASDPKRMAEIMSELKEGKGLGHNPDFTPLLFSFLFRARDGWG